MRTCRNCDHPQQKHPNDFLCSVKDCRCQGFFLDRPWMHRE